jgi:Cu-Zn family superoxide dismutase
MRKLSVLALGMLFCGSVCGICSFSSLQAAAPQAAPVTQAASAAGAGAMARATLKDAQGRTLGEVTLREASGGVLLKADLQNVPAGTHAFHIHTVGKCDAPDFTTAGGHFNPTMMKHGLLASGGPHAGDMPNVTVAADGKLSVEVLDANVTLGAGAKSLFDADGSAIVLHAMGDDYTTDPTGNAGGRLACGVVTR